MDEESEEAQGPRTPRTTGVEDRALAIGGCAEEAWAEAFEDADGRASHWLREANWAEWDLVSRTIEGRDAVAAQRRYDDSLARAERAIRLRNEAAALAGERDAYRLKSGMARADTDWPAFWLARLLTEAECLE